MSVRALKASVCLVAMLTLVGCETARSGLESAADAIDSSLEWAFGDGEFFSSGYIDEGDVCVGQRRALAEEASPFDKQLVQTALAGAAIGGIVAALSGENVLAGAAIGAGVGLAAGYLSKLQSEGRSPFDVVTSVNGDVEADNRRIDRVLAAFDNVVDCRKDEGRRIQSAFSSGQITRADAETQMANVRKKYDEDVAKAREITERIAENSEAYAAAYNEIAADNGARGLEVKSRDANRAASTADVRVTQAPPPRQTSREEVASLEVAPAQKTEVAKLRENTVSNVRKRNAAVEKVQVAEADQGSFALPT